MERNPFLRLVINTLFPLRSFNNRCIRAFARKTKGKDILELGSGLRRGDRYPYSAQELFHSSNRFTRSDLDPCYGHRKVDITTMRFKEAYDVILCMNVLEHVPEFQKGADNLHRALRKGGTALIFVPGFYPLHGEPHDYWRFTEHGLRHMLKAFSKVDITVQGKREYPLSYFITARK